MSEPGFNAEMYPDTYDTAIRIVRAQLTIDALNEEVAELKAVLRNTKSADYERENGPKIIVKVTPNTRIDDGLARKALDEDTYNTVSKQTIDTAKARAFLNDEQLAKITKTYDNKVEVRLA